MQHVSGFCLEHQEAANKRAAPRPNLKKAWANEQLLLTN
jgi:hypothetical protein